ncbi:NfeD family protein [Leptolyngbya sp. CCNP1308]|uniref:NfeD family protein n=1 Tax=Leptolyngbya sp. CCNP1308 TaxID=3110255 RepID=UPI002B1FC52F|nr:NfeD family protein [Leptolyngbya sp. CCNP1308]MEA5447474.1 NfeD family protein [Leptolyngbya sp. CCNP1308]
MTEDVIEDVFPEADSPQDIQWVADSDEQPTFPEGAWTDKTALVEAFLEGRKCQVKFEGVYWTAVAASPDVALGLGDTVAVLGREGNELIVQKLPDRQLGLQSPSPQGQAPLPDPLF